MHLLVRKLGLDKAIDRHLGLLKIPLPYHDSDHVLNIAYNLLKTAAGGNIAIGPVLLGAAKPVHILTASTTVRRIVNMTALIVVDAGAQRGEQRLLL